MSDAKDSAEEKTSEQSSSQAGLESSLRNKLSDSVTIVDPLKWSFGLTIEVERDRLAEIFSSLKNEPELRFDMLVDVTAVDWMDKREPRFDVVYQLLSLSHRHRICVKVLLPEESPSVRSAVDLWPAANFLEREVWDMFGITFEGHPDLRRILLYEEFQGYPLRKDYPIRAKQPRVKLRVPELRNTSEDMTRGELVSLPVRQRLHSGQ